MKFQNIPGKSEREKKKESGCCCWFSINRSCSEHPRKVVEENWEKRCRRLIIDLKTWIKVLSGKARGEERAAPADD